MNKPVQMPSVAERVTFTADEFTRMGALGAFDDMWVELVDGEIQRMPPPNGAHASRQMAVGIALSRVVAQALLLGDTAVQIDEQTVLGIDVGLLRGASVGNRAVRPDELLLAIEIAQSSFTRDAGLKRVRYAEAGIPHYWIVDNRRGVTHVYGAPVDGDYQTVAVVPFDQPLPVPGTDAAITLA
jgi:Uma2 family endonuclease